MILEPEINIDVYAANVSNLTVSTLHRMNHIVVVSNSLADVQNSRTSSVDESEAQWYRESLGRVQRPLNDISVTFAL